MALPILDGNQSATTLSSILTSGEHIPAHTVVSLGTQAITDISGAVSGSVVSISNFPATQTIAGTVTAFGEDTVSGGFLPIPLNDGGEAVLVDIKGAFGSGVNVPISGTVTANLSSGTTANPIYNYILEGDNDIVIGNTNPLPISGTVTANLDANSPIIASQVETGIASYAEDLANAPFPISGTVTVGNSVTIGSLPTISGTVTANLFGEAVGGSPNEPTKLQCDSNGFLITSLHRSGSDAVNYDPVAGNVSVNVKNVSSVTIGNSVTISSLPALVAGTAQIGSVTASISNSVTIASLPAISGTVTANLSISSTVITSGSFSSLSSATLVPENPARKMATVFNLGAGQLFINAGVTATTLGGGFMVALSSGDFYECDYTTTTLSAIFATAGTASWMSH
jgi:hypothetical protein